MSKNKTIPVYLFTGFLESGKTTFIQDTMGDKRFCRGERTLLLVCEEGEEEYEPDNFVDKKYTYVKVLEQESELTAESLAEALKESKAERVVVEYNGMWMLDTLYNAMPENWVIYQEFMFADAGSFLTYNDNMRSFVYDKLKSADLCVFNRFKDSYDKMEFHKIVRGATRSADIAYEFSDDRIEYDDIKDPLPFDIEAPIVEIGEQDYAEWYRDINEDPEKYDGKTVRFVGRALQRKKVPHGSFLIGRHIMTCCVDDISFAPFEVQWEHAEDVPNDTWIKLTAEIQYKFSMAYGEKGPVLKYVDSESCNPPEQEVATFY